MIRYKHKKNTQALLLQRKSKSIKKDTAFKAKIMLENEETWKEVSKVWKAQLH
jgi:hypothetical protein